jgi:hypothetical protein
MITIQTITPICSWFLLLIACVRLFAHDAVQLDRVLSWRMSIVGLDEKQRWRGEEQARCSRHDASCFNLPELLFWALR